MIVVSDTSPISSLYLTGRLHLLQQLYGRVIIPEAVYGELLQLEKSGKDISFLSESTWIVVEKIKSPEKLSFLLDKIDAGEAEAIILAKELNADWVLIDEAKGRKLAQLEKLPTIGLLGVLLAAKAKGFILVVKEVMDELKLKAKFRIHDDVYREVLLLANEQIE